MKEVDKSEIKDEISPEILKESVKTFNQDKAVEVKTMEIKVDPANVVKTPEAKAEVEYKLVKPGDVVTRKDGKTFAITPTRIRVLTKRLKRIQRDMSRCEHGNNKWKKLFRKKQEMLVELEA